MRDLGGIRIEWVELPLAELIAAASSGHVDMIGQAVAMLPSRSFSGIFAGMPIYYEGVIPWLKAGKTIEKLSELDDPNVRIAVLAGSSQQYAASVAFPKATLAPFEHMTDSVAEVAAGRADAALITDHAIAGFASSHPNLNVFHGPPVWVDANSYIVPRDDFRLHSWITTWARYHASHKIFATLWDKWVGRRLRAANLAIPLSVVGTGGEAVTILPQAR